MFWRRSHHLIMTSQPFYLGLARVVGYSLKAFQRALSFLLWDLFYMHTFLTCLPSTNFWKAKTRKLFSWIFPKQHSIYILSYTKSTLGKMLAWWNWKIKGIKKELTTLILCNRGLNPFFSSIKGQIVNILGFECYVQFSSIFVFFLLLLLITL